MQGIAWYFFLNKTKVNKHWLVQSYILKKCSLTIPPIDIKVEECPNNPQSINEHNVKL